MSSSTTTVNFEKKQCGLTILLYSGMTVSFDYPSIGDGAQKYPLDISASPGDYVGGNIREIYVQAVSHGIFQTISIMILHNTWSIFNCHCFTVIFKKKL